MSETLSAIIATGRRTREQPALYIGLAGDAPSMPGSRISLAGVDRVDLGRRDRREVVRQASGLSVGLPDARMSSSHARLTRVHDSWIVEDLGSKNGTWLGTRRVTRGPLSSDDAILVGHTALVFAEDGGDEVDAEAPRDAIAGTATLDPALAERFGELARAARSTVPIEITGETGTGKELAARAIHEHSKRSGGFVAVNCGALPPGLLEAELFGHRKGAYTGAADERVGLVRSADGGTLFLDEVAELPPPSQAALLRVLQEGEVVPLGGDRPIKIDLRVVTATHKLLDAEVEAGRFRADLRARLIGFQLVLPPLRERRADLASIVAALLERVAPRRPIAFAADAVMALYAYDWPLNIRELERYLGAAAAIAKDRIELHHLPAALREQCFAATAAEPGTLSVEDRQLREQLVAAIERRGGNLAAVARELGKDRTQIRRWMRRFGLAR